MSAPRGLPRVADHNLPDLLQAERAVLILAKADCGYCAAYEREVLELQERGGLQEVIAGKLVLDAPGSPRFKRDNPWILSLPTLPYTLLYVRGRMVDRFAASRGTFLRERIQMAYAPSTG